MISLLPHPPTNKQPGGEKREGPSIHPSTILGEGGPAAAAVLVVASCLCRYQSWEIARKRVRTDGAKPVSLSTFFSALVGGPSCFITVANAATATVLLLLLLWCCYITVTATVLC